MKMELKRFKLYSDATVGKLYVDGVFECYTLEDVVRSGPKIPGETAIPTGTYPISVTVSPKFKKRLPRLSGVVGFTDILIHGGNTDEDTRGCILVGDKLNGNTIAYGTSQRAFKRLMINIEGRLAKLDHVTLTITNEFPEEIKP